MMQRENESSFTQSSSVDGQVPLSLKDIETAAMPCYTKSEEKSTCMSFLIPSTICSILSYYQSVRYLVFVIFASKKWNPDLPFARFRATIYFTSLALTNGWPQGMPAVRLVVIHSIICINRNCPASGIWVTTRDTITIRLNICTALGCGFGTNSISCNFHSGIFYHTRQK